MTHSYFCRFLILIICVVILVFIQLLILKREIIIPINSNYLIGNNNPNEVIKVSQDNAKKLTTIEFKLPEALLEIVLDNEFNKYSSVIRFLKIEPFVTYQLYLRNNILFEINQKSEKISSYKTKIYCENLGLYIEFDESKDMGYVEFSPKSVLRKIGLNGCFMVLPQGHILFPQGSGSAGLNGELSIELRPIINKFFIYIVSLIEVIALLGFLNSILKLIRKGLFFECGQTK